MRLGSACTGIGGLDLGVEMGLARLGIASTVVWQIEKEPFRRDILARHFPEADRSVHDLTRRAAALAPVDLVSGGIPCQPHSVAGRREGIADDRWLWPAFFTLVRDVGACDLFLENVPGLLSASDGAAFGIILRDLAQGGWAAEWISLRASDVGAPHERERVFLLAHRDRDGQPQPRRDERQERRRSFDGGQALADAGRVEHRREPLRIPGSAVPAVARDRGATGDETLADAGRIERIRGSDGDARRWADGTPRRRDEGASHVERGREAREGLADPDGARLEEHGRQQPHARPQRPPALRGRRAGEGGKRPGLPEPELGGALDGAPRRLDGAPGPGPVSPAETRAVALARHQWPAGRGLAQHAHEPPRTIPRGTDPTRAERCRALGDAVVWQQAAEALVILWRRLHG